MSIIDIVEPSITILTPTSFDDHLVKLVEQAGRTCYKSEHKITDDSAGDFVKRIAYAKGHESITEHASITARIICSRICSHQEVRHRLQSVSQESQRYCDYSKGRFGYKLQAVLPPSIRDAPGLVCSAYLKDVANSYKSYLFLRDNGIKAEDARYVLAPATKTEIVTTMNVRQWRHVIGIRTAKHAQWEIRQIMNSAKEQFAYRWPAFFGDLVEGKP